MQLLREMILPIQDNKTKEKILKEAVNLFYEQGFTRASTRQLAGRTGIANSAIYNHFLNKEEILFTIVKRAGDKVVAMLEEAIDKYKDPVECLRQMISGMLYLFSAQVMRKEIAVFIDELYQLPEDLRELCNEQHRHIFNLFRDKIREIDNSNSVHHTVASFGILGAMLWVYHWYRDNGALSMEYISDELIKLLFNGLIKTDSRKGPS